MDECNSSVLRQCLQWVHTRFDCTHNQCSYKHKSEENKLEVYKYASDQLGV